MFLSTIQSTIGNFYVVRLGLPVWLPIVAAALCVRGSRSLGEWGGRWDFLPLSGNHQPYKWGWGIIFGVRGQLDIGTYTIELAGSG